MTTNEKICKWLGFSRNLATIEDYYWRVDEDGNDDLITPDFFHDRNQQKWIEDELVKEGWELNYSFENFRPYRDACHIFSIHTPIYSEKYKTYFGTAVESKDTAFISAVLELIENESNSPK